LSLEVKNIVFTKRKRTYSTEIQKEITIQDVMTSETFERAINGQKKLTPADASKYDESQLGYLFCYAAL
jgi:hypothetical protein